MIGSQLGNQLQSNNSNPLPNTNKNVIIKKNNQIGR